MSGDNDGCNATDTREEQPLHMRMFRPPTPSPIFHPSFRPAAYFLDIASVHIEGRSFLPGHCPTFQSFLDKCPLDT